MTRLTALIRDFAILLTPASGNDSKFTGSIAQARGALRQMHGRAGFDLLRHRILLQ
jgi:hypothetical protein